MSRGGLLAAVVLLGGCSGPGGSGAAEGLDEAELPETITVSSSAFNEGAAVPAVYTCEGIDRSPPLSWSGVPDGAVELAIVLDDPDAPRGTYVHWVVVGLSTDVAGIEEGGLPGGARVARNSAGSSRYKGPCPPGGKLHHYRFTVYALDERLDAADGAATSDAIDAIRVAAVARGRLVATFER